ncbi:hypothetical protein PAMP_022966 [Pampus punctatissimus]
MRSEKERRRGEQGESEEKKRVSLAVLLVSQQLSARQNLTCLSLVLTFVVAKSSNKKSSFLLRQVTTSSVFGVCAIGGQRLEVSWGSCCLPDGRLMVRRYRGNNTSTETMSKTLNCNHPIDSITITCHPCGLADTNIWKCILVVLRSTRLCREKIYCYCSIGNRPQWNSIMNIQDMTIIHWDPINSDLHTHTHWMVLVEIGLQLVKEGEEEGLCTGEFTARKFFFFGACVYVLLLTRAAVCMMATASSKTELKYPPLSLKFPAWEHFDFLVKYCNGERQRSVRRDLDTYWCRTLSQDHSNLDEGKPGRLPPVPVWPSALAKAAAFILNHPSSHVDGRLSIAAQVCRAHTITNRLYSDRVVSGYMYIAAIKDGSQKAATHQMVWFYNKVINVFFGVFFFMASPPCTRHPISPFHIPGNTNRSQSRRKDFFQKSGFKMCSGLNRNDERTEMRCKLCRSHPHLADKTDRLVRLFQDTCLDDWATKLVAVCTDGAAVNVRIYNGVVPKLRQLAAVAPRTHWRIAQNQLIAMFPTQTTETFDPKQAVELWMETANRRLNQGQRGASAAFSSSTMQGEAVDSGGDTDDKENLESHFITVIVKTQTAVTVQSSNETLAGRVEPSSISNEQGQPSLHHHPSSFSDLS